MGNGLHIPFLKKERIRERLYSLEGLIEQDFRTGDLFLTLKDGTKIEGNYGHKTWWIPINKQLGLKINNGKICDTYNEALAFEAEYRKIWETAYNKAVSSRQHFPKIAERIIIKYSGHCIRGGFRTYKHHVLPKSFFICNIIGNYEKIDEDERSQESLDKIRGIIDRNFRQDGIKLHDDTFGWRQIGVDGNKYIVLDMTTSPKCRLFTQPTKII